MTSHDILAKVSFIGIVILLGLTMVFPNPATNTFLGWFCGILFGISMLDILQKKRGK